jgi:hypothetical protein
MDFIHKHLVELVIFVPIILILGIMGVVQYFNMLYEAIMKEERDNGK